MSQKGIIINSGGYHLLGTLLLSKEPGPRPTAVLLHGVPGIEKNYDLGHRLRESGWHALIFHYRGCWGSQGVYNLKTIPDDVLAAVAYLESGKQAAVDRQRIAVIGHSLGGWAAVLAAAREPRIQAVAVYGSVTGPGQQQWTQSYTAAEFTPWLNGITPNAFVRQWQSLGEQYSALISVSRIAPRPLLIIHSRGDQEIAFEHGKALFEHAVEPRLFLEHPTADHSFSWHRKWLRDKIVEWLTANMS